MKKSIKKGFTLVELLVVIAIIAILSVVGIVGYVSFTNRARISNDTTIVTELNRVMQAEHVNKDVKNMQQIVNEVHDAGFILTKLTPTASKHHIVYDMEYDRFFLLDETYHVVAGDPKYNEMSSKKWNHWKVVQSYDDVNGEEFSFYLGEIKNPDTTKVLSVSTGIDVGDNVVAEIKYERTPTTPQDPLTKDVVIRTNGGTLTIDAQYDTVKHYGNTQEVVITKVSDSSYYEYGKAGFVDIKNGRIVLTNSSDMYVGTIYLTATNNTYDNIIIASQVGTDLPKTIAREDVTLPETGSKLVVTIQQVNNEGIPDVSKTEEIYLYPARDVKEGTHGYEVSDLGLLVVEAISFEGQALAAEQITNVEDLAKAKEAKVENIEEAKEGAQADYYSELNLDISIEKVGKTTIYCTLQELADYVNGGESFDGYLVNLLHDVTLEGTWNGIGSKALDKSFSGTFDGKGYYISNMINHQVDYTGFFGKTTNAVIKNLSLEGELSTTSSSKSVGGLIGRAEGSLYVENVVVDVDITGSSNTAGLVGLLNTSSLVTFKNVVNKGNITCNNGFHVGGFIGKSNSSVEFINCVNEGDVTYVGDSSAGGFCAAPYGGEDSSITFVNCQNKGDVICTGNGESANAGGFVGGASGHSGTLIFRTDTTLDGYTSDKATANYGLIRANNGSGGIVGSVWQPVEIENVYNYGKIEGGAAGGIVGINQTSEASLSIISATNTAAVEAKSVFTYGDKTMATAGGVIGAFRSAGELTMTNCSGGTASITSTAVANENYVGRLIGDVSHPVFLNKEVNITIDNANGDDNSIGMIGVIGRCDKAREIIIASGTLIANPSFGQLFYYNNVIFKAGTSWNKAGVVTEYSEDTTLNFGKQ